MIFLRISLLTMAATLQMSHGGDRDELLMQMLRDHGRDCECTNGLESINKIKPPTPSCASQPVVPGPQPTPSKPAPPQSAPQQPTIPQTPAPQQPMTPPPPAPPQSVPQQPTILQPPAPPRPSPPQSAPQHPTILQPPAPPRPSPPQPAPQQPTILQPPAPPRPPPPQPAPQQPTILQPPAPQKPMTPPPPAPPQSVPQQPTILQPPAPPRPSSPQPAPQQPTHAASHENEIKPTTRPPPQVVCKKYQTNGSPFRADSFTNSKRLLPLFEGTPNSTRLMEVPKFNLQEHKAYFNKEYGVTRLTFKWPGHRLTFTYYGYFGLLDAVAKDDLKDVSFYTVDLIAKKIKKRSFFFFDLAISKLLCPKRCVNPDQLDSFPSSESCRTRIHETKYVERLEEEIETHQVTRNFIFLFPGNELTITYYGQDKLDGCSLAGNIWDVGNYSFDNIRHRILISD